MRFPLYFYFCSYFSDESYMCSYKENEKKWKKEKEKKKESPFFGVSKSNKMIRDVSKAFAKMRALIFGWHYIYYVNRDRPHSQNVSYTHRMGHWIIKWMWYRLKWFSTRNLVNKLEKDSGALWQNNDTSMVSKRVESKAQYLWSMKRRCRTKSPSFENHN